MQETGYFLINEEHLKKFCDIVILPLLETSENPNECIELIYDNNGNLEYSNAHHIALSKSYDEFLKEIKSVADSLMLVNSNLSIIPVSIIDTQKPNGRARRSKRIQGFRTSVWILEIEPNKQQKIELTKKGIFPLSPLKEESLAYVKEVLDETKHYLPKDIASAVEGIYLTGGGINLIVKFNRPAEKEEINKLSDLFKKMIREIKEIYPSFMIDESSCDLFHAQRLAGTLNHKYKGNPVLFIDEKDVWFAEDEKFEPLNLDFILMDNFIKKTITKERFEQEKKKLEENIVKSSAITDYKMAVEELNKIDIPSVFSLNVVKEASNYYLVRCPFHPPDEHPSFVVYKNLDKDGKQIAVDLHDGKVYDAIELAKELWGLDFKEAVNKLGEITGITPDVAIFRHKKRKEEIKQSLEKTDSLDNLSIEAEAEKWLKNIGVDLDSVSIVFEEGGKEIILSFDINSPLSPDGKVSVKFSDKLILNPNVFIHKLRALTVNRDISYPYEKPKEIKEFLSSVYVELVLRAYINRKYEVDKRKLGVIINELVTMLLTTEAEAKTLAEFLQSKEGVAFDKDGFLINEPAYILSINKFYETVSRIKSLSGMSYDTLLFYLKKVKDFKIVDSFLGIDYPFLIVPASYIEDYRKKLKTELKKIIGDEELVDAIVPEKEVSLNVDLSAVKERKEEFAEDGEEKEQEISLDTIKQDTIEEEINLDDLGQGEDIDFDDIDF